MVKRTILTILICIAGTALFWAYFHYAGRLSREGRLSHICTDVNVIVTDSLESTAVNKLELHDAVSAMALGNITDSVNVLAIENMVKDNGEVLTAEVFASSPNGVSVILSQRKPVVRFKNRTESYYCDSTGYLFPVKHPIQMPLVTGAIPMSLGNSYKGFPGEEHLGWVRRVAEIAIFIEKDAFWKRQIQQIDIEKNGDIVLLPEVGRQKIVFGSPDDYKLKFKKLEAFYKNIVPEKGMDKYTVIDLKYKNQIICR